MGCGALLLIGFHIHGQRAGFLGLFFGQPQPGWSVEHTLLLKLLGSSLASGLERVRTTGRLAEINEREQLLENTVNDGTWDFDARNNRVEYSPRWKRMMGYDDADLARNAPDWRRIVHVDDYARLQAPSGPPHRTRLNFRVPTACAARTASGAGDCAPRRFSMTTAACAGWLVWNRHHGAEGYEEALFREKRAPDHPLVHW
jgi:PAS domain-containing protein